MRPLIMTPTQPEGGGDMADLTTVNNNGNKKQKVCRKEPVSFSQNKQLFDEIFSDFLTVLCDWKKEITEITASTQRSTEEFVKKEVGKVQRALIEEMAELRGSVEKEKMGRTRPLGVPDSKHQNKIVWERKKD